MSSQSSSPSPSGEAGTQPRGAVFTPHTRVVVRMFEGSNHPYDGRAGEIVSTRKVLGVTMCTVRFDPVGADGKIGVPVEMFASELSVAPPAGSVPAMPAPLADSVAATSAPATDGVSAATAPPAESTAAAPATAGALATNMAPFFDKAWETREFADLADAPVDALQGVSQGDAELLRQALGIATVRDLATNKFVRWAQAIVKFANA